MYVASNWGLPNASQQHSISSWFIQLTLFNKQASKQTNKK
jgi:hypothetical protein